MSGKRKMVSGTSRPAGLILAAALLLGARPPGHADGDGVDLLILDAPERVTVVRRIGDLTVVESRRRAVPRLDGRVRVWEIGDGIRLRELPGEPLVSGRGGRR